MNQVDAEIEPAFSRRMFSRLSISWAIDDNWAMAVTVIVCGSEAWKESDSVKWII